MKGYLLGLAGVAVLFTAGGATCSPFANVASNDSPVVFVGPPTLADIIVAINGNSAQISRMTATSAAVSTPGYPSLRASLDVERPRRFRLQARMLSPELDIGSNDELVWFWAKSDPDAAIYYAYVQQFQNSATGTVLPIDPAWLIETIGLISLDPTASYDGPSLVDDRHFAIQSRIYQGNAPFIRRLVIDSKYGWITEQRILDSGGRSIALARCSNHRFYPEVGAALPHRVQVELPSAQLSFTIESSRYEFNHVSGDPSQLWSIPTMNGYRLINLASDHSQPSTSPYPTSQLRDASSGPRVGHRPSYRGMPTSR